MISELMTKMKDGVEYVLLEKYDLVETSYQPGRVIFMVGKDPKKMITLNEVD